jgi:hypothetical protein
MIQIQNMTVNFGRGPEPMEPQLEAYVAEHLKITLGNLAVAADVALVPLATGEEKKGRRE